ncbi:MAG: cyclase family protein [Candidatus Heimdallarchaeota archaeon]|nr:cyclase family protein [Candidatus Heimdallarchaeota archaeon]
MKVFDISMEISETMIFYPGDRNFELNRVLDLKKGDPVNLSEISMNVHTGTHLDAPIHYIPDSASITDIDPSKFFGNAKVFDFTNIEMGAGITELDLSSLEIGKDDIILFKTKNSEFNDTIFKEDFVYLTQEGAAFLVSKKIKSVGIDYLSIGKYKEDKKTHLTLLQNNILIYEGLNLKNIHPGEYLFCGFPLKIKKSEGAPVRAVLLRI